MKKPLGVKILLVLQYVKLGAMLIFFAVMSIVSNVVADDESLLSTVREVFYEQLKLDASDPSFAIGYLIGLLLFPAIFSLLTILFIHRRLYVFALVLLILDFFTSFGSGSPPLISIVCLVLVLTRPVRHYLQRKEERRESVALDDQLDID